MRGIALAAVALALGPFVARTVQAQLVLLSEVRRADSSVFVSSPTETDDDQLSEVETSGVPFDVSLVTAASITDAWATATGAQLSSIEGSVVSASGSASADAAATGDAIAYGSASSHVAMRFQIPGGPYTIQGFVDGGDGPAPTVQLSRPFQTVAFISGEGYVPVSQQGVLESGTYDLNITCGAAAQAAEGFLETGVASYGIVVAFGQTTDIASSPGNARLHAFPNPFRTGVRLVIPEGTTAVRILDARGRVVRELEPALQIEFDGRDRAGRPLASGVYWVRALGDSSAETIKVVRLQ